MRVIVFSLIVILNFIISTTWLQGIAIGGILPNTALIIVVSYALLRDDVEGAIIGFGAGLLYDIFFSSVMGVSALLMMFVGFLAGKPFRDFFKENYIAPIVLVAAATLAYEFAFYVLNFLLFGRTDFLRYLGSIILPTAAYNLVLCIFIYRLIYGVNRLITKREDRRRGLMK
ncbi:MAG: rod shape-determining protein MreD [Clostridiales bacterium]|jgi:rod shape-determining protein MreD|nr:rod shape-determining protein MreD [Clostridiales bacterium]